MSSDSRFSTAAVRLTWPLLLSAALLLPSVAWVSLNRSVWQWDQAWYGYNAVQLWRTLRCEPAKWRPLMETAMVDRAAGVCWLGQFFVPLGKRLGSIDIGLGLSIIATQLATLLFLWGIGRRLAPEAGWRVPLAGCLLAAGAPLFVGMSHQFFAEPLQTLAVAWIFYLAVAGRSLSRLQAFSQLLAASALGLAAKVSTPMYCLLPGLVALYNLLPRRTEARPWWKSGLDAGCLAGACSLAWMTYRWYYTNWTATLKHAKEASSGEVAAYYGHRDGFLNKAVHWLEQVQINLATPKVLWLLAAAFVVVGIVWATRLRQRVQQETRFTGGDLLVFLGLIQLGVVLASFSVSINEETRYLLPILPAVAVAAMWCVARMPTRLAWVGGWALVVVLLLQWGAVNAVALGWTEKTTSVSTWLWPLERNKTKAREVDRLYELLTADEQTAQRYTIIGVDRPWFNPPTLAYQDLKRQMVGKRHVMTTGIPWLCQDGEQAYKSVQDCNALYVVFVKDSQDPPEFYNKACDPLLQIIRANPRFAQVPPLESKVGLLLFRRVSDVK